MRLAGFIGPSYLGRTTTVNAERTVNLYPEVIAGSKPKNQMALIGTPGDRAFLDLGIGPVRGMIHEDGRAWAVGGGDLFEIFANKTSTKRGSMANSGDPASMALNGKQGHQLLVLSGGRGYILDLVTNVLVEISTPGFPLGATQCGFVDGYFVVVVPGTSLFQLSGLFKGLEWSTLDRAARSTASDNLVGLQADHRELWLGGSERGEVWVDSGKATFPFEPLRGTVMQVGLLAPWSFLKMRDEQALLWLGKTDGGVRVFQAMGGYTPRAVSTHAVENVLNSYGEEALRHAVAYGYQEEGHSFYVLNIPTAPVAWVYDVSESVKAQVALWHERTRLNAATGLEEAPTAWQHVYAFGLHLTGSREDGQIYESRLDLYSEHGTTLPRIRRAPYLAAERKLQYHARFELECLTGVGLEAGQGSDPKVMLRWSDDDWDTIAEEFTESLGKQGEAAITRVQWFALGSSRARGYEIAISDPVQVILSDAYLDVAVGAH